MPAPPNEVYTAFSFIGFLLCAIPFYWHLEAWNTGTCLYMIWVGLGCLSHCINSIIWNKNMIDRVPVYCDISTRFQVAIYVAIASCSLCINRRLYKIATMKSAVFTSFEKRRAVMYDLVIGVGIPVLQIIFYYVVSANRYNIYEDFGPDSSEVYTPLSIVIFAWPVVIGTVSLFYCVTNIYIFYKRGCQSRQLMSSAPGLTRGQYFRLMAISAVEILGTIPFGIFRIVYDSKLGITPWRGWAYTHKNYSEVFQVPASLWKNDPHDAFALESKRWFLVIYAFIFFALFGFTNEARQNYRLLYSSIASRVGYSMSALLRSPNATSSIPYVKRNGGIPVSVVTNGEQRRSSSVLFSGQSPLESISVVDGLKPDSIDKYSPSNTVILSSVECLHGPKSAVMQDQSALPAAIMPTVPSATVPSYLPVMTKSTFRAYPGFNAV